VIEAMADTLISMVDVESLALVCEALYAHDDDEGVWQTLAWSIKEAEERDRYNVSSRLREVADLDSVAAREGSFDVLSWLGLLTEEEIKMHPPFLGGYAMLIDGERREICLADASKVVTADFGEPPHLVALPFSLTAPERGILYLVETEVPDLDAPADLDPNDEWTLAVASVAWEGKRSEMISRNHVYRIAGRHEVERRMTDYAVRSEWRVRQDGGGKRSLQYRETFLYSEAPVGEQNGRLVERVEILQGHEGALTVLASTTTQFGTDQYFDERLPVRSRESGEITELARSLRGGES